MIDPWGIVAAEPVRRPLRAVFTLPGRLARRIAGQRPGRARWGRWPCPNGGAHRVEWRDGFGVECPLTLTWHPGGG